MEIFKKSSFWQNMQCNTNSYQVIPVLQIYLILTENSFTNFFYKEIDSMRLYPQKICDRLALYINFYICEIQSSFRFIKYTALIIFIVALSINIWQISYTYYNLFRIYTDK